MINLITAYGVKGYINNKVFKPIQFIDEIYKIESRTCYVIKDQWNSKKLDIKFNFGIYDKQYF